MIPVRYDPEQHMVADIPFTHVARREVGDELLFTYRHRRTENWVLAAWLKERWGTMLELVVLGKQPTGTREDIQRVINMKRDTAQAARNREFNRRTLRNADKVWGTQKNEEQQEYWDVREFLHRRIPGKAQKVKHHVRPG